MIYNAGTLTLKDVSVKNNITNSSKTISNVQTLNIISDAQDVLFEGNKAGATITRNNETGVVDISGGNLHDIYNTKTLNLMANSGKSITFNGEITDNSTPAGTINIGGTYDDNGTEKSYNGDVVFNNTVTQKTLNINSGVTAKFGTNGDNYGKLNLNNITNDNSGGLIDSLNDHIDAHIVGKAALNSDLNIAIDMSVASDLSINSDTFTLTSGNAGQGTFNISELKFLTGAGIDDIFKQSTSLPEIVYKF